MNKLPVPTAKDINEAHKLARSSAETAVEHAIRCGQLLAAKKGATPHGEFQAWIEKHCDFSDRQARRYIQAAIKTDTRVRFDSLRQLLGVESKPRKAESKRDASVPQANHENPSGVAAIKKPEPQKAIEVTPAPNYDFTGYEPEDDEEYRRSIDNVMMADDQLNAMREELKQARREIQALKASRDHYQAESGQAVRLVKARDREIAELKRRMGARAA